MASQADYGCPEVSFTNLDESLFDGAGATKRDLVDYLDGVADRFIPVLEGRPLSVVRVQRDQPPFMQKNVPKYAPKWVRTAQLWAHASKREVNYALCDDHRTLLWFANQRAVEYHPALFLASAPAQLSHIVLDIDPPETGTFPLAVRAALLVRRALAQVDLEGAVKTSGAKGLHVFVPVRDIGTDDVAAATRAIAARVQGLGPDIVTTAFMKADREGKVFMDATRTGGATVVAAYSPRARPGVPVSFPLAWDELESVVPSDFTVHTALRALGQSDPWAVHMPAPQVVRPDLIREGHEIPAPRVAAMHEGKARARSSRSTS